MSIIYENDVHCHFDFAFSVVPAVLLCLVTLLARKLALEFSLLFFLVLQPIYEPPTPGTGRRPRAQCSRCVESNARVTRTNLATRGFLVGRSYERLSRSGFVSITRGQYQREETAAYNLQRLIDENDGVRAGGG